MDENKNSNLNSNDELEGKTKRFDVVKKPAERTPLVRPRTVNHEDNTPRQYLGGIGQPSSSSGNSRNGSLRSSRRPVRPANEQNRQGAAESSGRQNGQRPVYVRQITKQESKSRIRKKRYKSLLFTLLLLLIILVSSVAIATVGLSCVNDILAMNRSKDKITLSVPQDMSTEEMIELFAEKDLIKNKAFCKLFYELLIKDDDKDIDFIPGVYELSPSMGLEVMLNTVSAKNTSTKTVMLTFPEGYTVDQIIKKLAENNVCSEAVIRQTMLEIDFSTEYSFLPSAALASQRYHILEGFMFPDTYDFYVGENANSVIHKFLDNFYKHWTDEYAQRAAELNMSVDQVVSLASIIEKEAFGSSQMYAVSSVLHNRLNDTSGSFRYLGCDSTAAYIDGIEEGKITQTEAVALMLNYDTFQKAGLPVGAICNPGEAAIKAALNPDSSNYYYFCHDKNKKIYLAQTNEQHNNNFDEVRRVNSAE